MNLTNSKIPIGLGMALAQNLEAMEYFSKLSDEKQKSVINATKQVKSKQEMQLFVETLKQNY